MDEAIHCFQQLGLTQYESSALAALFSKHDATAEEISDIAEIPYTKIYGVLSSLEKLGLLKTTLERPKKYRPLSPDSTVQTLLNRKKNEVSYLENRSTDTLDILGKLNKEGEKSTNNEAIIFVPTKEAVWDEVLRLGKEVKNEFIVVADDTLWKHAGEAKKLGEVSLKNAQKGIKYRAIIPDNFDIKKVNLCKDWILTFLNENFSLRVIEKNKLHHHLIGIDKKIIGFTITDPLTLDGESGYEINNEKFVASWWDYFDMLWGLAEPAPAFFLNKLKETLGGKQWKK